MAFAKRPTEPGEQLSLSNTTPGLMKSVTPPSSHKSNSLNSLGAFFRGMGIASLHFKSTEHLFATQQLAYQKVILALLDIQYHKNQCKIKQSPVTIF